MDNMVDNSFLTKAEVSDISNFVLDGSSAAMLSAETAIGTNPSYSVSVMKKIIMKVEKILMIKLKKLIFQKMISWLLLKLFQIYVKMLK